MSEAGVVSNRKYDGRGHLKMAASSQLQSEDTDPNLMAFNVFLPKELEI